MFQNVRWYESSEVKTLEFRFTVVFNDPGNTFLRTLLSSVFAPSLRTTVYLQFCPKLLLILSATGQNLTSCLGFLLGAENLKNKQTIWCWRKVTKKFMPMVILQIEERSSQLLHNLSSCEKKAWKKIQAWTGHTSLKYFIHRQLTLQTSCRT